MSQWVAQPLWAALYLGAGVLGGLTRLPSPPVAFVWPAAGVALIWFLLSPASLRYRVALPALLAVAFAANYATNAPSPVSLAFALANVAHAAVGGEVFLRIARHTPDSLRDIRGLLAIGTASVAGAVAGTPAILAVLAPAGVAAATDIVWLWIPRFAASAAVVVALVLAWLVLGGQSPPEPELGDVWETVAAELAAPRRQACTQPHTLHG
ncbi:MAG TPA: hypothetical protein PKB06_05540, partial [Actinotalea sp.]|nr:hypothetical protein [Actinotalea sp.]